MQIKKTKISALWLDDVVETNLDNKKSKTKSHKVILKQDRLWSERINTEDDANGPPERIKEKFTFSALLLESRAATS